MALPAGAVAALKAHRKVQSEERFRIGRAKYQDHGLVIAQPDGTPWAPDLFTKMFLRLVRRTGLPRVRFHDLRHGHASHLLEHHVDLKVISERLGHSGIGITADLYTHVAGTLDREAAAKMDGVLGGGPRQRGLDEGGEPDVLGGPRSRLDRTRAMRPTWRVRLWQRWLRLRLRWGWRVDDDARVDIWHPDHMKLYWRLSPKTPEQVWDEWKQILREHGRARRAVRRALQTGRLVRPDRCECYGEVPPPTPSRLGVEWGRAHAVQAHHMDYRRPLDVVWVCSSCHDHLSRCEFCKGRDSDHERWPTGWLPPAQIPPTAKPLTVPGILWWLAACPGFRPCVRLGGCRAGARGV